MTATEANRQIEAARAGDSDTLGRLLEAYRQYLRLLHLCYRRLARISQQIKRHPTANCQKRKNPYYQQPS
jgi:hypothetical protein